MSFELKFLSGPLKGQILDFDQDEVIFGRNEDCDVILKDGKISGEHCGIFKEDGEFVIEDFESTNGTYVNTSKIKYEKFLSGGEVIIIGSSRVSFSIKKASRSSQSEDMDINPSLDEFELDEDTNVKKIKDNRGFKKFFDPDYYIDLKEKFLGLNRNKQIAIVASIILFFIIFSFLLSGKGNKKKSFNPKNYPDYSEKIHSSEELVNKLWGYYGSKKFVDFSHPKKLRFSFVHNQKKKMLIFAKFKNIDYIDELEIKINNKEIMYAPITGSNVQNVKIDVPLEYINLGEDNLIEFINKRNLNANKYKKWAVFIKGYTYKLLPEADVDQAMLEYKRADKLYIQRRVSRGNRFNAYEAFGRSMDFMELMDVKPPFYNDCLQKRKLLKEEINKIFIDSKYAYYRAIKFDNYEEAKEHLYHIVEEIPDESDDRYSFAMRALSNLR